jgi:hypothetical protein
MMQVMRSENLRIYPLKNLLRAVRLPNAPSTAPERIIIQMRS